mmetsp:Transcript_72845/g.213692  ORF Transcript_72845/g.213692 Transcript_72845/m.213692 type:complete len:191 (+) Transcript_72845:132-704(+)
MLLPAPAINVPPTRFALQARPLFLGILVAQVMLMIGRFLIMDLWGAMLSMLVVMMGSFVVSTGGGMDTTYCLYYGLMCLVNGIFDVILCLERWMHVKYPLFARNAPVMYNVASAIFVLCPVVELAATVLSAYIYMDAQEQETRLLLPHYSAAAAEMAAAQADIQAAARGQPLPQRGDRGFKVFEGRCEKI